MSNIHPDEAAMDELIRVVKQIDAQAPSHHLTEALCQGVNVKEGHLDRVRIVAELYIEKTGDPTGLMTKFKTRLENSSKARAARIFANLDSLDWP